MTDYVRSEDEQVAALKDWWKKNGTSIIVGVAMALTAIFGWQAYQKNQYAENALASQKFQQLLDASTGTLGAGNEEAEASLSLLAKDILDEQGESGYGVYARLLMAKVALENEQPQEAVSLLQEASANNQEPALKPVIAVRLARALAVQGDVDGAVKALELSSAPGFSSYLAEVKGDLLKIGGRAEEARAAYREAITLATAEGRDARLAQMKLDDLAGA